MTKAILFDLDGTLADTAPSLIRMVNSMLRDQRLPALPYAQARNLVSRGALPLLRKGFDIAPDNESETAALFEQFLQVYRDADHSESCVFIELNDLFDVYSNNLRWGIVTNKLTDMTQQLLATLPLPRPPDCVVCGDTLSTKKPDPAPLLHAAWQLGVTADDCIYVGDDERDIIAGHGAGMRTVTAAWGYIPPGVNFTSWDADAVASHPSRLLSALQEIQA